MLCLLVFGMQVALHSQTTGHPTVDTIEVAYKGAPDATVLPEATISLKSISAVSKIHYKIIDPADGSVVYTASYSLGSSSQSDANGTIVFLITNSDVQIISTSPIPLKAYAYQVQTEDSQGLLSAVYNLPTTVE